MLEKTLVILKPDAITRGLTGEITERFEKKGLKLVASKMISLDNETLEEHYDHLRDKPFFSSIVDYMTSSPVIVQIWEGAEAVDVVRLMIGVTNPRQAQPGTIRGDYAMSIGRNVVHASEDRETAESEIKRFFSEEEIFSYKRTDESMLYEEEDNK